MPDIERLRLPIVITSSGATNNPPFSGDIDPPVAAILDLAAACSAAAARSTLDNYGLWYSTDEPACSAAPLASALALYIPMGLSEVRPGTAVHTDGSI